jgi:hypothetical protein
MKEFGGCNRCANGKWPTTVSYFHTGSGRQNWDWFGLGGGTRIGNLI